MKFFKNRHAIKHCPKLKKQINELEYKNRCLKKCLEKKKNELKVIATDLLIARESSFKKLEFIAHQAHEYKTPLNAIIGFTTLMEEKEVSREKQLRYCRNILSASKHLLQINHSTIDMARAATDKIILDYSQFNPAVVIREVLCILEELISQKQLHVTADLYDARILADKRRFKQIIFNLVGNAIKYNKSNGTIKINAKENKGNFIFEIADSGIGIAQSEQEKIFEFFSSVAPCVFVEDEESTGIGLSVCKKIITQHGGDITFSSSPDEGTIFSFFIPAEPSLKEEYLDYLKI